MTDLDRLLIAAAQQRADGDVHVENLLTGALQRGVRYRRRRRIRVVSAVVVAVLAVTGGVTAAVTRAGGGPVRPALPGPTTAATTTGQPPSGSASTAPSTAASSASASASGSASPVVSPPPANGRFTTPSRNIGCVMTADLTYCFIFNKTWTGPSHPADCEGDNYERELAIGPSGKAANRCDGQPQFAYDPSTSQVNEQVLDYGNAFQLGSYRCVSQQTGIQCDNTQTGHGFTLSRETYRLY